MIFNIFKLSLLEILPRKGFGNFFRHFYLIFVGNCPEGILAMFLDYFFKFSLRIFLWKLFSTFFRHFKNIFGRNFAKHIFKQFFAPFFLFPLQIFLMDFFRNFSGSLKFLFRIFLRKLFGNFFRHF